MDAGYAIYPGVVSKDECEAMLYALSKQDSRSGRAGTRHLMKNPHVTAVAGDTRLMDIASTFVGTSPVPFRATLFEKTEQANWLIAWHQDLVLPLANKFECAGWGFI